MYFERITINPKIVIGNPCIRDTRIPVSIIIKLIANKETFQNIIETYPELSEEDITACLNYAAWSVTESILPVSV